MNRKTAVLALAIAAASAGPALADDDLWRDLISSGLTTASTYMTFKDDKLIVAAQDDASSFIASDGQIRGPYLEAALQQVRQEPPAGTLFLAGAAAWLVSQGIDAAFNEHWGWTVVPEELLEMLGSALFGLALLVAVRELLAVRAPDPSRVAPAARVASAQELQPVR